MKCFNCNNKLEGRNQKKFCSQNCAASFNNRKFPKRVAGYRSCRSCKKQYLKKDLAPYSYCDECKDKRKSNLLYMRNPTKKEMIYEKHTHGAAYAYIRWHSRKVVMKNTPLVCAVCGYSNHVEVAHKKPISAFDDNARLLEINDLNNLVYLCPNHHWELDHNNLKLVGLEGNAPSSIL